MYLVCIYGMLYCAGREKECAPMAILIFLSGVLAVIALIVFLREICLTLNDMNQGTYHQWRIFRLGLFFLISFASILFALHIF